MTNGVPVLNNLAGSVSILNVGLLMTDDIPFASIYLINMYLRDAQSFEHRFESHFTSAVDLTVSDSELKV